MNGLITSLDALNTVLSKTDAVLLYFSTISCQVGEALEPKVKNLLQENFPMIEFYNVDLNFSPDVCSAHNVFVEPTILVFFDGKETIRKSRNIGVEELFLAIERPYNLFFN